MNCIVTAGPTFESLDQVRRLTNFSTGKLGTELANFLAEQGHTVVLLKGHCATYPANPSSAQTRTFTTAADLSSQLEALAREPCDAIFHAAAVTDFSFGKVWKRSPSGELTEVTSGKLSSSDRLVAELVPTPKIIGNLRAWFSQAWLVGWKYEVEGDRARVLDVARQQLRDNKTDACVANGPAYGDGFGLVEKNSDNLHLPDLAVLFSVLAKKLAEPKTR